MAENNITPKRKTKDERVLEELKEIKVSIEVLKTEYPDMKKQLNVIQEKVTNMSERIARVEVETESAHEKIESFKKAVLWTIGASITACGTLVGIISFLVQTFVVRGG